MKLHGYWRSSASWRVRIALHWKQIPFDYVPVHLVRDGGEQHSDSHRASNPMEQVPVLEMDDGTKLTQSLAIIEYLEELQPQPPLLPADSLARARVRQLAEIVNSGIQPLQNLSILQQVKGLGVNDKSWARHWVGKGLGAMEALASKSAGAFCVGDSVTIADVCLIPQLYSARRFELDLAAYPTLLRIEEACAALPAFAAAHADRQPDAVP